MAPHSSTLAWKIPWTEEPGRLQSMGSWRVGHDWATSLFTFLFHALEKEMATHSSVLAWRIPGTGEPGGLLSMESHRVGHDWSDLAAAAQSQKVTLGSSAFSRPEYLGRTNIIMICSCFKYFPEKKFISTTHIFSRTIDNLHTYDSSPVF